MRPTRWPGPLLLVFAATFSSVAFAAPGAVSTKSYNSALIAIAGSSTEIAPCVTQFVQIQATDAVLKGSGATRSSFVDVVVNQFNSTNCPNAGVSRLFAAGTFDLASSQFSVSNNLSNATLKANLTLTTFIGDQTVQLVVDLKWRGSDTTQTTNATNVTSSPFLVTQSNRLEKVVINAQVTGKVISSAGLVSGLTGTLRSAENGSRQFLLGAGRQAPSQLTRSSTIIDGSGLIATANYGHSPDACIFEQVFVSAEVPAAGNPNVTVNLQRFDLCVLDFASVFGVVDLPPGALIIASDLKSASLIASVILPGSIPVSFNLSWVANGTVTTDTLRTELVSPTSITTMVSQGSFASANLSGDVTSPGGVTPVSVLFTAFIGSQFAGTTIIQN